MAFRDSWHRALVYFGLAEEYHDDDYDEDPPAGAEADLEDRYRDRPNVRRLRRQIDDPFEVKLLETIRGAGYRLRAPQR